VDRYRAIVGAGPLSPPSDGQERSLDCLGATLIGAPANHAEVDRCVALVATESYAHLLDGVLRSLERFGGLPGVLRVVFVEEHGGRCEAIARSHDALVVKCLPLRGPTASVKGALYSMSRVVRAKQYLCLDADVLVLGDLGPLFVEHARLAEGRVLIAAESTQGHVPTLKDALVSVYQSEPWEIEALIRACPRVAEEHLVANDGVFVADRAALQAADELLSRTTTLQTWTRARTDVWWRPKGALNVALAQLGAAARLDSTYNVQLHIETVERASEDGRVVALWRGHRATVLHFNGGGREAYPEWKHALLGR
jgi:hypothetical protein